MSEVEAFHETRFPLDISLGAVGGPTRKTEVISLVSGHEKRNTKWADSRRNYNAGFGIKSVDDLQEIIEFFEDRRARLHGFRFRDPLDHNSCKNSQAPSGNDQILGAGDGSNAEFQLQKHYGNESTGYKRIIDKPVAGTISVALNGQIQSENTHFTCDITSGLVTFLPNAIPALGDVVTAGFEFDVPVRFDTDEIAINLVAFQAGEIPSIPMVEIKI